MKVFLGGTCAGWKWRNELQPLLKCQYYNPIVKNWSESDRLREVHERETFDYVLYLSNQKFDHLHKKHNSLIFLKLLELFFYHVSSVRFKYFFITINKIT